MILKEAIESGLPYKRKNESYWYSVNEDPKFDMEDVLSEDWEIQTEKEYTHRDLVRALDTVKMYVNPHVGWLWKDVKDKAIKAAKEIS